MFKVKPALIILATSFGIAATNSHAGSTAAFDACKLQINEQYSDATSIRFKNNPATSTRGGKYTFLINAAVKQDNQRQAVKAKCVTTKEYEVLSLNIENGRW